MHLDVFEKSWHSIHSVGDGKEIKVSLIATSLHILDALCNIRSCAHITDFAFYILYI